MDMELYFGIFCEVYAKMSEVICIVATVGGEIERDREALLPGGQIASVKSVGIFRGGEAGILPDGPGLVDIHRGIGATQIGRDAGPCLEEIDAFEVGFAVLGLDEDAFGREPRLGAAGGFGAGGVCKSDIRKIRYAAHASHYSTCDARGSPPLIMIRMLVADDAGKLFRAVVLQRGLARQIGDADHPAEPGFGAELLGRYHPVRPVERTGHDLDPRAVDAAEAERRAAIPAEIALGDGGGAERGRFAAGPGEVAAVNVREGCKWRAGGLLAHPAMTDADFHRRCRHRKADGAALAAAGQDGFRRRIHAPSVSR